MGEEAEVIADEAAGDEYDEEEVVGPKEDEDVDAEEVPAEDMLEDAGVVDEEEEDVVVADDDEEHAVIFPGRTRLGQMNATPFTESRKYVASSEAPLALTIFVGMELKQWLSVTPGVPTG